MITRGYLILNDTDEETGVYAIPITNFPILPQGTTVQLDLATFSFEDLYIHYYILSNTYGTLVFIKPFDFDDPSPGAPSRAEMQSLFKAFPNNQFDYVYSETICFG